MPTRDELLRSLAAPSPMPAPDTECAVCYEPLNDPVQLPCQFGHVFCRECVTNWLQSSPRHNTCPTDRERIWEGDWDDDSDDDDPNDWDDDQQAAEDAQWQLRQWRDTRFSIMLRLARRALEALPRAPASDVRNETHTALLELINAIPVPGMSDSVDLEEFADHLAEIRGKVRQVVITIHRRVPEEGIGSIYVRITAYVVSISPRIAGAMAVLESRGAL